MPFTTGAPTARPDLAITELAAYRHTTVRLHPRRGTPGVYDSHIGGPLLWPAAEPWPPCTGHGKDAEREPLVAVAQFTAADFPEIRFPEGTDLLQVLWCPEWDDQPHPAGWGPACRPERRRAAVRHLRVRSRPVERGG